MLIEKLKNISVILGSQSPRRKELLASMDIDFEVEIRPVDETIDPTLNPYAIAEQLALYKLSAFDVDQSEKLIITSDTIVVSPEGLALGKPRDIQEAFAVIRSLSGRSHDVLTGVAVRYQKKTISFTETTKVEFAHLSDEEISYYIAKYAPFDKAGAYGIQEWIGRIAISKLEGSFENVMGLPTQRLYQELKKIFL